MTIGTQIRKIRELKDLTQEDVARELGCSQNAYSKIERGQTDPKFSKLKRIAKIFNVELAFIINFDENMVFNENQRESTRINENQRESLLH